MCQQNLLRHLYLNGHLLRKHNVVGTFNKQKSPKSVASSTSSCSWSDLMHSVRRVDNTATTIMPELARCTHPRIAQLANGDIMLLMLLIITGPRHQANINQALIKHQSRLSVNKTFSLIILGDILTTFSVARLRQGVRCVASFGSLLAWHWSWQFLSNNLREYIFPAASSLAPWRNAGNLLMLSKNYLQNYFFVYPTKLV